MRGKKSYLNSISFYAPLDQRTSSLSIRFNNFPPYSFHIIPTHFKKKKKKKNLSILQLNSEIPSLLFPPLFLQKKEICTPVKFSILNQIWHSPFPGEEKKREGEMERREEKSRGSKRSVTRRKQHQHQIWSQATRAGCFSPQGKIVLPRFMRADKKEDGGKQRESRDIWPVFLVREEFSSSVPSKVQRRNTKGNCRELLQRRFLLGRRKVVSLHEEEESWAEECDA